MNKKTLVGLLGGAILGASLSGCRGENYIEMDVTGYTVSTGSVLFNKHIEYTFSKQWNEVSVRDPKYTLYDGGCGVFKLDGKVDRILSKITNNIIWRYNLSEVQAKEFDDLLAEYKELLNIDQVHKEWEENYKK